jgi:hypothetical protein
MQMYAAQNKGTFPAAPGPAHAARIPTSHRQAELPTRYQLSGHQHDLRLAGAHRARNGIKFDEGGTDVVDTRMAARVFAIFAI